MTQFLTGQLDVARASLQDAPVMAGNRSPQREFDVAEQSTQTEDAKPTYMIHACDFASIDAHL